MRAPHGARRGPRAAVRACPSEALASLTGSVVATTDPVHPERAWRRGRTHHEWWPAGERPVGSAITPDLEDVVIAASLARRSGVAA